MAKVRVLLVGLEPSVIDFSSAEYAKPGVSSATIQAAIDADIARLRKLGYDADFCGCDFGATAEAVVRAQLAEKPYDCVVIGAGVRLFPKQTPLLETLVNTVRAAAPQAKFAFNTTPADTADAVQRWFPQAE